MAIESWRQQQWVHGSGRSEGDLEGCPQGDQLTGLCFISKEVWRGVLIVRGVKVEDGSLRHQKMRHPTPRLRVVGIFVEKFGEGDVVLNSFRGKEIKEIGGHV
ncbi:hypothetical protein Tco_0709910 [Tanacetum coccineum]